MNGNRLDSRAWLAWGLAAMLPPLLGRNPWLLIATLIIVATVRASWRPLHRTQHLGWFLRIAAVFVVTGVVFNLLTVHAGTSVLTSLPESWPIVGGTLTLNALVYGVLSGAALFTLVLAGITVAANITWVDLFHALPARLAPLAVTGSVAWSYLPQMAIAWQSIRETHAMRGHRLRGARAVVPLVTPLLAASLERSLMMAEVLEARGFGSAGPSSVVPGERRHGPASIAVLVGLVGLAAGGYGLAVGSVGWGLTGVAGGGTVLTLGLRNSGPTGPRRSRLRALPWTRNDTLVVITSMLAASAVVAWSALEPEAASYRVYPRIAAPAVNPWVLGALALLLTPAYLAPSTRPPR